MTIGTRTRQATIPVHQIDPDPNQPRKLFRDEQLDELAQSMRELGQLQPITVRPNGDRYTLIMGERRWRAAKRAGIPKLHALILELDDEREIFIRAVAENVGRADMTPMEEAKAFRRLVNEGFEIADIAARCGKSFDYVRWRIDLLGLVPAAQEAVEKGHVPTGVAWYVCRLSPDLQKTFLAKWTRGEFTSARDAEAFAQACRDVHAGQESLLLVEEPSAQERAQIAAKRRRVVNQIERLATAGAILQELAQMDAAELARVLDGARGGVTAYRVRIDHLKDMASKASSKLRRAAALSAAATLELNPSAIHSGQTA